MDRKNPSIFRERTYVQAFLAWLMAALRLMLQQQINDAASSSLPLLFVHDILAIVSQSDYSLLV
jgi:hypothetical protein